MKPLSPDRKIGTRGRMGAGRISRSLLAAPLALLLFLAASSALAIPKEIEEALKLNRINHYDEALGVVERALEEQKIKPDITSAYTIGRILFRKGELYREIADISTRATVGYLSQVEQQDGTLPDDLKLFLGMAYFFDRQYDRAVDYLKGPVRSHTLDQDLQPLAVVYLGASYFQLGDEEQAADLWQSVRSTQVLAYSTLGFLYAYLQVNPATGENMTRRAVEGLSAGASRAYRSSFQVHHAYTLLKLGRFHEAYAAVSETLLDHSIYTYQPDQRTEMRLYDLSVLNAYSSILFGESVKNLEPIVTASSGELAGFASYYVAQMYLYMADLEQALRYAEKAQKLSVTGSLTMMRAVACEVSALIRSGREKRGNRILKREIDRVYGKPSVLLEMMNVIITSGVRYESVRDVAGVIESYISGTEWNRTRRDYALLGEMYFYLGDRNRAIFYLERARDKGNKNRIETNDPGFLLTLSYVYYGDEAFPESLEILFSLGKYFSGVRPLQDAVQSVYSYKQRGTGEAFIE